MTFDEVAGAIAASWCRETCDPDDLDGWHVGNPSRGQCGATALVVHDYFRGELLLAEVTVAGEQRGFHYWNLLPDGVEVDLTRGQFHDDEAIGDPKIVRRPARPVTRCADEYALLTRLVRERLTSPALSPASPFRLASPGSSPLTRRSV